MKLKRIIAWTLAAVMFIGAVMTDVGAYAVDIIYELDDNKKKTEEIDYESTLEQYLTLEFATAEDKLATMELKLEKDGYQLYVDSLTGEVATVNMASGQILFSNPYDVGAEYPSKKGPSDSTKKKIMSQIMVRYTDNDTEKEMYSFEEAAMRGQIKIKNIKNGIRVEYSIGREETRMLVPKLIEKSRFEEVLLDAFAKEINEISISEGRTVLEWRDFPTITSRGKMVTESGGNTLWFNFNQFRAYYQEKSADSCSTTREKNSLYAAYPICKKMDVYVFATDATQTEMLRVENYIKTYISSYTYETLEYDHNLTEYEGSDKNPPLFKMSLEYSLDEWGMTVRLPANGLRFNESLYQLEYISLLPYMGCGANYLLGDSEETFTGYNFFPDGSGTIFRHEELAGTQVTTINAKVYGLDFAYNEITGSHTETVRYPVFGIVSNYHTYYQETENVLVEEAVVDPTTGEVLQEAVYEEQTKDVLYEEDRGFVGIIEEGDALAELSTYHAGSLSKYNSISMLFYPRPKDSYNLANAISVGANASWTVVSKRKYVGNYKIRYIMLTDSDIAAEKGLDTDESYKNYEVSWMGMAQAYRDYLYDTDQLSALEEDDVSEDIPAYIETFGALETLEKILSMPVNVMTPLTSFENVKTMYDELSAEGVTNIKFKLTGYANGGMTASVPYKLKWEKAVGGSSGYTDLVEYADEKGFQVFPDFDFSYVRASTNTLFDGLTLKQHIVKSINDTYMSKRYYSATKQTMLGRYELAISAAYYSHFYEKLSENLLKYYGEGIKSTISVDSLGSALNSDFDEDEPYNREDTKKQTINAFAALSESFDNVMTQEGNAYTWNYVDYIVDLPLDSSRYNKSSASVPFLGVVLHGSVQFSGSALNMEGNIGYSLMKAIENGAGIYFVLCYQNYAELKDDYVLSQYYSVRYDILKDDIVSYYTLINDLTKDLQLEKITAHEFLYGERVPDEDEVIADEAAALKALEDAAAEAAAEEEKARVTSLLNGRVYSVDTCTTNLEKITSYYDQAVGYEKGNYTISETGYVTVTTGMETYLKAAKELSGENGERTLAAADYNEKEAKQKLTASMLEQWSAINNPFTAYLKSGNNNIYATLLANCDKAAATTEKQAATLETKKEAMDTTIESTVAKTISSVGDYLKSYNTAKDALAAISDADKAAYETARKDVTAKAAALVKELTALNDTANLGTVIEKLNGTEKLFGAEITTVTTAVTTALKNVKTGDTKAATTANTDLKTAAAALTKVETLYKAESDAYNKVMSYAGSLENAENYAALAAELKTVNNSITAFKNDYASLDEYKALKKVSDDAEAAYKAAKTAGDEAIKKLVAINTDPTGASKADIAKAAEYAAAKAKLDELDAERTKQINYLSQIISTATTARTGKTAEGTYEYQILTQLIEDTQKKLADYEANPTAEYTAAKAAVDAFDAETAKAEKAYNEAKAALDAYVEDFKANYETNAKYVALKADAAAIEAKMEVLEKTMREISPVYSAVEAFAAASKAKTENDQLRNKILNAYLSDAQYQKLKDAYDEADNKLTQVYNELVADMENDADYKKLKEAAETTQAALEVYTLAYEQEEEYLELKQTADEAAAEVEKLLYAYKSDAKYTELTAAAEKAEKAYQAAYEKIVGVTEASKTTLNDALIKEVDAAITAKSDADNALKEFVEESEAEAVSTKEYKTALAAKTTADAAVTAYITAFQKDLDTQYNDSKTAEKPEETLGYKYHEASEAATKAKNYFDYYTGAQKVPTTVKDAKVYTTVCESKSEYTAAKSAKTTASTNLSSYTGDYTTKAKASAEYIAANDAYTAANTAVTEASTALRNVDSALYSAVSGYWTAYNTLASNTTSEENAKLAAANSGFKAGYEKTYQTYKFVGDRYELAVTEAAEAETALTAASIKLREANSKLEDATKNIKLQINRVLSNIKQQNVAVSHVITADEDAQIAYDYFSKSSDYSAALKSDMAATYKTVRELADQVKVLSAKSIEASKNALNLVKDAGYLEDTVNAALEQVLDPYVNEIVEEEEETEEEEVDEDAYEYTKYTDDSGNIVRVGYENGVYFILNYNYFAITTVYNEVTYTLPAYGGVRVNPTGDPIYFSTAIYNAGGEE